MLITPAADLATATAGRVVTVPLETAALPSGGPGGGVGASGALPQPAGRGRHRPRPAAERLRRRRIRPARPRLLRGRLPRLLRGRLLRGCSSSVPASSAAASSAAASSATAGDVIALLAPLYGQAAWLGEVIPVHDGAALLRSAELADRAARSLQAGEALLLRGNGALTLGATPGLAVARMWLLSAACDVYLSARPAGPVTPLSAAEIASWRAVSAELLPRLWQHLRSRVNSQTARLR